MPKGSRAGPNVTTMRNRPCKQGCGRLAVPGGPRCQKCRKSMQCITPGCERLATPGRVRCWKCREDPEVKRATRAGVKYAKGHNVKRNSRHCHVCEGQPWRREPVCAGCGLPYADDKLERPHAFCSSSAAWGEKWSGL